MKGRVLQKSFVPAAIRLSAALCAVTFGASAETYYLTKANVSQTALASPQYWKAADGTVCTAISEADDFVANGYRAYLRPTLSSTGYFLGGSFSIGGNGADGSAILYLKNAVIGFEDYGTVASGGLLLQGGLLDIGSVGAGIYQGTVVGRVAVMAPKSAPFKIRCPIAYPYSLVIAARLAGDEDSAFEFGSSLPQAVPGIGGAGDSISNFVLTLSGDCGSFLGTLAMTGCVDRAEMSGSGVPEKFASMLVLSNTVFSGTVVLNGGCVLSAAGPSNICTIGTLDLRPNSVLMVTGGVTRAYNTGFPESRTNAFFHVAQSCTVQGPISLAIPGCEAVPDGTTNRIAMFSVPAGTGLEPSDFTLVADALPPVPHRLVVDVGQDGREMLVCEVEPYAVLLASDNANLPYNTVVASSLTNAAAWSDGEVPHAGVNYVVQRRPYLPGTMSLQTPTDNALNSKYAYTFLGRRLIICSGCRLISRCGTFNSTDLPLRFLDGSHLHFASFQCTRFIGGVDVGEGTFSIQPYAGSSMEVDRLTGAGTVATGTMLSGTDSVGGYYCFADASGFYGKIDLRTTSTSAISMEKERLQHLFVSGNSLGGALDEFTPDALRVADFSVVYLDGTSTTQTLANTVNRGVKVDGVGRFCVSDIADRLRIDWPVTYNGALWKEGDGTLSLGGAALFGDTAADVPAADGTNDIVLMDGTLEVASAAAVDGCRIVVSNDTRLVVAYDPADVEMLRDGLRNVKTATPFVLEDGTTLPLAVDLSALYGDSGPRRVTVGLVTVTNAAETLTAVRAFMPDRVDVSGVPGPIKTSISESVDAAAGTLTFTLTARPFGTTVTIR